MQNGLFLYPLNALAGWFGFLAGALSGAAIGLFFHREEWLGGYNSFRRRLLRLGHIACFGLGLINLAFALTVTRSSAAAGLASPLLVAGLILMPLVCFLSAARPGFRRLFFLPVGAVLGGLLATILHLL